MTPSTQLRGTRAREAILEAAGERFREEGYRRASIEAIAAASGVARPTVYAHFGSKEEIFRTIVGALHDEQLASMQAAVDSPGPIADRLYAALASRFVPFVKLTSSSPHGGELLDENSRVCGDITKSARARSLRLLEQLLVAADNAGEICLADADVRASAAATMLYDAARGAKDDATVTPAAYRRQLKQLVGVLSRGLGAKPAPRSPNT
jgi:AcrR family transcriptional regulator